MHIFTWCNIVYIVQKWATHFYIQILNIDNKYGCWNEFVQTYCTVQSTEWGLYGTVLVVQSGSSRKEGPVIPLLHTLRVYQSVEGAASAVIVSCTESRGHPRMELAFLISLSSLFLLLLRCYCSSRLLHRKWLMPPQSPRKRSGGSPAPQRTWASSADTVCSDLSCM